MRRSIKAAIKARQTVFDDLTALAATDSQAEAEAKGSRETLKHAVRDAIASGLGPSEVARSTNIARNTINTWKNETSTHKPKPAKAEDAARTALTKAIKADAHAQQQADKARTDLKTAISDAIANALLAGETEASRLTGIHRQTILGWQRNQ